MKRSRRSDRRQSGNSSVVRIFDRDAANPRPEGKESPSVFRSERERCSEEIFGLLREDVEYLRDRRVSPVVSLALDLTMRMRGLDPPRAFAHTDLNRARLPIPPHPRGRP